MLELILSVASGNNNIRAVILNGSRANKNIKSDDFQDYDIVYVVDELKGFESRPTWIDVFGERIILQMPNSMKIDEDDSETEEDEITYLMLFKDFNRIDLKLVEVKNILNYKDSLSKILLDKDHLFKERLGPSEEDYMIKEPSQKEFLDCCNEFWWVSTYVIKGLARDEPIYAKEMLENPVRKMFMKMLSWYVGATKGFEINLGNCNRFFKEYVSSALWKRILRTYPDSEIINIWNSLMEMISVFHELGLEVAKETGLNYKIEESINVKEYIGNMKERIINKNPAANN